MISATDRGVRESQFMLSIVSLQCGDCLDYRHASRTGTGFSQEHMSGSGVGQFWKLEDFDDD